MVLAGLDVKAQDLPLIFEVHVHFKWDQAEITSSQEALNLLNKAGVQKTLVIGRPADPAVVLSNINTDSS